VPSKPGSNETRKVSPASFNVAVHQGRQRVSSCLLLYKTACTYIYSTSLFVMVTLSNTFRLATRTCQACRGCRVTRRRTLKPIAVAVQRQFTSSSLKWADTKNDNSADGSHEASSGDELEKLAMELDEVLARNENIDFGSLDFESAKKLLNLKADSPTNLVEEGSEKVTEIMQSYFGEVMQTPGFRPPELPEDSKFQLPREPIPQEGFWNHGEEKSEMAEIGEDPEFEGDDITSMAHQELDQHREYREYARVAAWEMPLLSSMILLLTLLT
jgi:hypothetical protein